MVGLSVVITRCPTAAASRGRGGRLAQCWQVASQYLVQHLTHRGALWASGAAQAAQFVRIILRWRGVCRAFASRVFGEKARASK